MKILSSLHAYQLLKNHMISEVEEVWALALSADLRLLKMKMLFRGTVDRCLIHPRDIFRFALLSNASQIIIAHNHPQGSHLPSAEDIAITNRLFRLGKALEIPLVDHLVIGQARYSSMLSPLSLEPLLNTHVSPIKDRRSFR